jgi:hypothetical protein
MSFPGDFELPAARPVEPEFGRLSTWPPAAKVAGGCSLGCLAAVLLQALVIWFFTWLAFGMRPPAGMVARVQAPPTVPSGKPFPLVLSIRNDGKEAFTITNVTAGKALLRQFSLKNPQPAPANHVSALGSTVWEFRKTVEPGATWTVRFEATPSRPGRVRGSLEVQAGFTPVGVPFTVHVQDESPAPSAPRQSEE